MSTIDFQLGSIALQPTTPQLKRRRSNSLTDYTSATRPQIWWSNAVLFIAFHVVGLSAWSRWPSSWRTWCLFYINWQIATLGITIGNTLRDCAKYRIS